MNRISKHLGAALIAASLVAGVGFGSVASAGEIVKERVKVADLDLSTVKGKRALERRVDVAVGRVCVAPASMPANTSRSKRQVEDCRRSAVQDVQAQMQARGMPAVQLAARD
jgi:UrcA family protein